jgi:hypothetical protein
MVHLTHNATISLLFSTEFICCLCRNSARHNIDFWPPPPPSPSAYEADSVADVGIETLRERARTLEAERAALAHLSTEVHGLMGKIDTNLRSLALEDGTPTIRQHVSQFAAIQVEQIADR